jgi:hypothetical protein
MRYVQKNVSGIKIRIKQSSILNLKIKSRNFEKFLEVREFWEKMGVFA